MIRRTVAAAAVLALVTCAPPAAADKSKPKPTDKPQLMSQSPMSKAAPNFDVQMQAYVAAMQLRKLKIETINRIFAAAIQKAQLEFKQARAAATTAEAKSAAEAKRRASISEAIAARQKALNALSPKPVKPEPPVTPSASPAPSN